MDFRLPQIVATIEKFDYSVNQVFISVSESGYKNSLRALLDLVDNDIVLNYVYSTIKSNVASNQAANVSKWFENHSRTDYGLGGRPYYEFPNVQERIVLLYRMFSCFSMGNMKVDEISLWDKSSVTETLSCFVREFVGTFARDIRNFLVDLRVEAELSESKDVKEAQITNIILGGTNQLNQGNKMNDSSQISQK